MIYPSLIFYSHNSKNIKKKKSSLKTHLTCMFFHFYWRNVLHAVWCVCVVRQVYKVGYGVWKFGACGGSNKNAKKKYVAMFCLLIKCWVAAHVRCCLLKRSQLLLGMLEQLKKGVFGFFFHNDSPRNKKTWVLFCVMDC